MYSKTHSISIKGDNTGSCKSYAEYLDKSEGKFFNSNGEYEKSEIYVDIDKHSKGQLGKDDAKWYAPIYSFSENVKIYTLLSSTDRLPSRLHRPAA